MIPLRDENPTRTVPVVTYLLIGVNVLVWIFQATGGMYQTRAGLAGAIAGWTMIPWEVTHGVDIGLVAQGNDPNGITLLPTWLTILTSMFMHGGFLHVAGNMLYLYIFGNNIEDALGKGKFLLFYLLGGAVAAGTQISWNPNSIIPTLGASGAVAAVLGAYLILFPKARIDTLVLFVFITRLRVPAYFLLGFWIVSQFFSQFLGSTGGMERGGVAYMAHIGGFLAGMALIKLFNPEVLPLRDSDYQAPDRGNRRSWNR